jgi:hypothetical protein
MMIVPAAFSGPGPAVRMGESAWGSDLDDGILNLGINAQVIDEW